MASPKKRRSKGIRKKGRGKRSLGWTKLYGLGKGIWNGEDAQAYVDRLREDRV